jgi:hypothetical protein
LIGVVLDAGVNRRTRAANWARASTPSQCSAASRWYGASFVVDGAARGDDAAPATASAEVIWGNGIAVAATFEGEFSETTPSYARTGTVRYQWW